MDYQTRRNIKRTEEMGVKVRQLPIEETNRFFKLFKMAEENMASASVTNHTLNNYKRLSELCFNTISIY